MMRDIDRDMLIIKSLDNDASIQFSEYTSKWFVVAGLEIGDGMFLQGMTEHRETPEQAVAAYVERLRSVTELDRYIATRHPRHEYRWNGAAFVDVTRPEVLEAQRNAAPGTAPQTTTVATSER